MATIKLTIKHQCCIRRNPTKGIERFHLGPGTEFVPGSRVAFEEIPQRELRVDNIAFDCNVSWVMLHSKKSHKGNWEPVLSLAGTVPRLRPVAFEEIPQRELRVYFVVHGNTPDFPWLHSKKSHKGNWESIPSSWDKRRDVDSCCIRRNPTKGIESCTSTLYLATQRYQQVAFEEIPQRELRDDNGDNQTNNKTPMLHSKKSHKGNWETPSADPSSSR